jgi:serine O-acetyltransferase
VYAFILLLMIYPELRSVYYWRLGKLAKFVFFWMPGRTNLYLFTHPKHVDGGFYVGHGWGTVVNAKSIGKNFRVGQNVTIGSRNVKEPVIGDNVSVWANAIVLGDITLGNDSQVGAGAVVVKSIPDGGVVVPAKSSIVKLQGAKVNIPL